MALLSAKLVDTTSTSAKLNNMTVDVVIVYDFAKKINIKYII